MMAQKNRLRLRWPAQSFGRTQTIAEKPKVLVKSSGSGGMMAMFGGGSNAKDVTIGDDGKITEIPDVTQILTLEESGDKWLLQTGRTADHNMTYLYISDTDGGGSSSSIPGMGSNGATLKTGTRAAVGDSCKVSFTFPAQKNDSVKIQFNFADREKDGKTVTAKNVIRFEKGTMSSSFGGFEPESDKATLPRLYRLVQSDEYQVTITAALWATIISSYDVTLPEGLTGYVVKEIDQVNNEAVLHDITDKGGLKGGMPYLLKATEARTYTLTKAETDVITEPDVNLLQISTNETGNGVYVLANKGNGAGFYKWTGGQLGAGRVYLEKPASSNAPAYLPFGFSETTSINEELRTKNEESSAAYWYMLDGRRIEKSANGQMPKGLYIMNGNKIVIK